MASGEVQLGIVGLGLAARLMLPSLTAFDGIEVVAAADPRPDARRTFSAEVGGEAFSSMTEMLLSRSLDAVYIASPTQLHAQQVIEAANEVGRRAAGGDELRSRHGAGTVEHQRQVEGLARAALRRLPLELQQRADDVAGLRDGKLVVEQDLRLHGDTP